MRQLYLKTNIKLIVSMLYLKIEIKLIYRINPTYLAFMSSLELFGNKPYKLLTPVIYNQDKLGKIHSVSGENVIISVEAAEVLRKKSLHQIYQTTFAGLSSQEKIKLATSGKVWWDYSKLQDREVIITDATKRTLAKIDEKISLLKSHDPLIDENSSVWKAFQVAMSHYSTAIEGNKLSKKEAGIVIDEFGDGIAHGIGISEVDDIDLTRLHGLAQKDVAEVVNHAATMQFVRNKLFGKQQIDAYDVCQMYTKLMPDDDQSMIVSQGLSESHGVYRRVPIKVRGSPAVRPYPQEVPKLMENVFSLHYEKHQKQQHPIIANILLVANFLYVHPFPDGNGRVSRLLLQTLLYNSGYFGCLFPARQRKQYISNFDPYFLDNEFDLMASYTANRINLFHQQLRKYEIEKVPIEF